MSDVISSLVAAITAAENSNPTYNNPGSLSVGDIGYGTFGQNITIYPTIDAGMSALTNQVTKIVNGTSSVYSPDMTLSQVGSIYAGGDTNWAKNVANKLGVSTSTTINQLKNLLGNSSSSSTDYTNILKIVTSFLTGYDVTDGIFIVVGLMLIAGGIFAFKGTQTIIETVGKHASKIAEVTA